MFLSTLSFLSPEVSTIINFMFYFLIIFHILGICLHIQPSHPLLSPLLPTSVFPSIRVFSSKSVLHIRWPKYWSFSFSISPSKEYSELISFGQTGWISLQSKGLSRIFSNTTVQSINSLALSFFYGPTLTSIHDYGKSHSFDQKDLCQHSNVSAF